MTGIVFAIPGDIRTRTGGYEYDRRLLAGLAELGVEATRCALPASFPATLLVVGAIIPRKAHDLLVDLDWRPRIVGSASHAPATAKALARLIAAKGLEARIDMSGELASEALAEVYDRADLFVSASHYEGYGMALAEAMAHGLPIVASTGGAAAETVPEGAALKCRPGDVVALQDGLREAIGDPARRLALAEASWRAGQGLPRWDNAARVVARVAAEVGAGGA